MKRDTSVGDDAECKKPEGKKKEDVKDGVPELWSKLITLASDVVTSPKEERKFKHQIRGKRLKNIFLDVADVTTLDVIGIVLVFFQVGAYIMAKTAKSRPASSGSSTKRSYGKRNAKTTST
ncbi:MAG: hypothetical protein ABIQ57_02040, partial [Candidatus Kapaibacterium sp.]